MAAFATLVCQRNCGFSLQRHKTAKSCAFCDSLPVSASVCVFAFDTGGLWLWLGAFEKSGLYRCQSAPGPPMPCFVAQSFVLAAFATLVCQRNCVFLCKDTKLKIVMPCFCGTELRFRRLCNFDLPNKQRFSLQRHKSTRIRLVPNSWIVMPVFALECFSANETGVLISEFSAS